ncbi:hypothetical protein CAPTEDRAFT_198136 [Capitella teleta]|uniref:Uncharacterized protein n=1 Tax=Capitella teleta TaxID=283909 RepID=X1ZYB6_CAPTE|nr:hypothetical protein CAPTEDRAFT_198136 [Capitella teleta]|eukprot:ELU04685.1 hypothetical protein CAPTEDRAFT_198136 [Capitella teleta]
MASATVKKLTMQPEFRELLLVLSFYCCFAVYILLSHHFPLPKAQEAAILNSVRTRNISGSQRLFGSKDIGVDFARLDDPSCKCSVEAWTLHRAMHLTHACPCSFTLDDGDGNFRRGTPFDVQWDRVHEILHSSENASPQFIVSLCSNDSSARMSTGKLHFMQRLFPNTSIMIPESMMRHITEQQQTQHTIVIPDKDVGLTRSVSQAMQRNKHVLWVDPFQESSALELSKLETAADESFPRQFSDSYEVDFHSFLPVQKSIHDRHLLMRSTGAAFTNDVMWWWALCDLQDTCSNGVTIH